MFGGSFAPAGFALCDGSLLSISSNQALFAVLGTTFGGNGTTTFGLPDLRGRAPVGAGTGSGLSPYVLGQSGGQEQVTLQTSEIPSHSHAVSAGAAQTTSVPSGAVPAQNGSYAATGSGAMAATMIGSTGGGAPHPNLGPFLTVNYIIALIGLYPAAS